MCKTLLRDLAGQPLELVAIKKYKRGATVMKSIPLTEGTPYWRNPSLEPNDGMESLAYVPTKLSKNLSGRTYLEV